MQHFKLAALSFVATVCLAPAAHAECRDPHPSVVSAPNILIDRTDRIVIARRAPMVSVDSASEKSDSDSVTIDREKEIAPALEGRGGDRINVPTAITRLEVIENIKGDGEPYVFLASAAGAAADAGGDFDGHQAAEFWDDPTAGRARLSESCQVRAPFSEGERYLIFVGAPHVKAYEAIKADDDKWLDYVRARVSSSN